MNKPMNHAPFVYIAVSICELKPNTARRGLKAL
jgi:hypothetical protein